MISEYLRFRGGGGAARSVSLVCGERLLPFFYLPKNRRREDSSRTGEPLPQVLREDILQGFRIRPVHEEVAGFPAAIELEAEDHPLEGRFPDVPLREVPGTVPDHL